MATVNTTHYIFTISMCADFDFVFAHFAFATCRYIIGAETAHALGNWRWALRVTPALGVIAVLLIFLTREPERGQHEGSHHLQTTSYKDDLIGTYYDATNHWGFTFWIAFLSQIFPKISRLCCQHLVLRALHLWRALWHGGAQNSCTMVLNCNRATRISNWKSKFSFSLGKWHAWSCQQWALNQLAYQTPAHRWQYWTDLTRTTSVTTPEEWKSYQRT